MAKIYNKIVLNNKNAVFHKPLMNALIAQQPPIYLVTFYFSSQYLMK